MADIRICDAPSDPDWVCFKKEFGTRFLLTIDTEEEFDWSQPFDRNSHRTATVPALRKFLQFCEGFGVIPVFLVDYPVARNSDAQSELGKAAREGRADIGMQLHAWVNPPFEEELNVYNSFAGQLPASLERAKFEVLNSAIEQAFGTASRIFRSGRYGAGPNTAAILKDGAIAIDSSVRPLFDYRSIQGPDYSRHPVRPYWLDRSGGLLELPLTVVCAGRLRRLADRLLPLALRIPLLRGLLARTGLLERIPLTPEGTTAAETIRGIDRAIEGGLQILVFSFHSPSLAPGNTPYVRTHDDLDAFYAWWRAIFAHLASRGVRPTNIDEFMDSVALA